MQACSVCPRGRYACRGGTLGAPRLLSPVSPRPHIALGWESLGRALFRACRTHRWPPSLPGTPSLTPFQQFLSHCFWKWWRPCPPPAEAPAPLTVLGGAGTGPGPGGAPAQIPLLSQSEAVAIETEQQREAGGGAQQGGGPLGTRTPAPRRAGCCAVGASVCVSRRRPSGRGPAFGQDAPPSGGRESQPHPRPSRLP